MARPIWSGILSFGLLQIPVKLMPGERKVDLHFRMLDSRNNAPIRYERINADTGAEVPWKDIVKAYEYDKGNYVVLREEDFKAAGAQSREAVEIEAFVDAGALDPRFYEKPYLLTPGKKAEKGYVLLRETLAASGKIGIARVVIRTREYLSAVMPLDNALALVLLRYPQELVSPREYDVPAGQLAEYRISKKELEMAQQLIAAMEVPWSPADYRDEFRERLQAAIEKRLAAGGQIARPEEGEPTVEEGVATNVVDFMALLKQSLATQKRTPPKQAVMQRRTVAKTSSPTAKKPATAKTPAKTGKRTSLTTSQKPNSPRRRANQQ